MTLYRQANAKFTRRHGAIARVRLRNRSHDRAAQCRCRARLQACGKAGLSLPARLARERVIVVEALARRVLLPLPA
eukprot:3609311-Prymnesium_polylepis.2